MAFHNLDALIPQAAGSSASSGSAPQDAGLAGRRLLVVDDNVDAADSLGLMLQLMGAQVGVAYDGPTAIEMAVREQPEVVLLDIGMPGMDGLETARRLRAHGEVRTDVRLVALTGWGHHEDQERSRSAGFDLHLVKPVDMNALSRALATLPRA
jgi:CheY-like chemotaxis protein